MKLNPKHDDDDIEVDMSPMIDMVFLLLIFFIVASQVIDEKPEVAIPSAANAMVVEDTTGRLMITVTEDGTYYVKQEEMRTIGDLQARLQLEIDVNPDLRILIRSDANTKYKINEKVMTACGAVGATDLIYSAFEE